MDGKDIRKVLNFDAIQEAENITGKSYKENRATESLGFAMHIDSSKRKYDLLSSLGDTTFTNTEENYLRIASSIGFKSVLIEPFNNRDGIEERFHVMWDEENSILLSFDTYTWKDGGSWAKSGKEVPPPDVNGGRFYYNWVPHPDVSGRSCISSGTFADNGDANETYSSLFNADFTPHILSDELRSAERGCCESYEAYRQAFDKWCDEVQTYIESNGLIKIWVGNHDCREALKFNISELQKNGTFVKQWVDTPFLWLLHYMDTKSEGYDHEKITTERLNKLPKGVREAMGVND